MKPSKTGKHQHEKSLCKQCHSRNVSKSNSTPEGRARRKAWREANRERVKGYKLQESFGISWDEYQEMYEEQEGKCAICADPCLPVDHDHETGQNRALLCTGCNLGLGHFGDDPERLIAAAEYLRRWS